MNTQKKPHGERTHKRVLRRERAALWTRSGEPLLMVRIVDESESGVAFIGHHLSIAPGNNVRLLVRRSSSPRRAEVIRMQPNSLGETIVGCQWSGVHPRRHAGKNS